MTFGCDMNEKLEKFLRKFHIRNRTFMVVTSCIIVFTAVMLLFVNFFVRSIMQRNYFKNDEELQNEAAQSIEMLMTNVNLLTVRLMSDENLYRVLRDNEMPYEDKLEQYKTYVSQLTDGNQIAEVAVVDSNGKVYAAGLTDDISGVLESSKKNQSQGSGNLEIRGMTVSDDGKNYVCLGREYYYYTTSSYIGYLYVYINDSVLAGAISQPEAEIESMLITDDGLVLTASDSEKSGRYLLDTTMLGDEIYTHFNMDYQNRDCIFSVRRVLELDNFLSSSVYIVDIYPQSVLFESINRLIVLIVVIECVVMAAAILISYKNSNKLVQPIHRLQKRLENFGKDGKLEPKYIKSSGDEFAELEKTYNEMISRIADLTQKNIDEKLEQRKLQLDALQAQINPHFLYNTLDTIVWIAKIKKQKEIEELAMALAGFFRISLHKGDKFISVREELNFVKGFVLIQQTRFPDKFELKFDVPEELMDCRIFKITIQPFVENAIKHGISPKRGSGCITVRGYRSGDDLVFEIIDDGVGIKENTNTPEQGELVGLHGYGIKNVDERIRLEYGDEYGVKIESKPDVGTKVTVRMPYINHQAQ